MTTTPDTSVETAAETMAAHGFHHLPVVDDGTAVGVVTTTDLASYLATPEPVA